MAGIGYLAYRLRSHRRLPTARASGRADKGLVRCCCRCASSRFSCSTPVYLLAARTHPPAERWIGYGFFDKRWLVVTFLLGTSG